MDTIRAEQYTVGQWMDVWFENCAQNQSAALRPTRPTAATSTDHIKPSIGKIPLSKLSSLDLQKLYKKLLSGGRVERIPSQRVSQGLSAKTRVAEINQ